MKKRHQSKVLSDAVSKKLLEGAEKPRATCMVTVRVTEGERDLLNLESQSRGVSLNMLCRERIGLPARLDNRKSRPGNPTFIRKRKAD